MLNKTQRVYLRLVEEGLTSKQIAQAVGGSHHTVNVEIGIAMRLLGAKSRREAASLLRRMDDGPSYEGSYEPRKLEPDVEPEASPVVDGKGDGLPGLRLPLPTAHRPANEMSALQRIGWIVALAALTALMLGGLVSGVTALLEDLDRLI